MSYTVRRGTTTDIAVLVHHRTAMFMEMGDAGDYEAMRGAFTTWLERALPSELYRAWVVCDGDAIVAGCGLVLIDRAPSPTNLSDHSAYVYNVYVEPDHRNRGLARLLMETLHAWCRDNGIGQISLHASKFGQHLYETMGYQASNEMRLQLTPR